MSTTTNPSEQLRFVLDVFDDFAEGRFDALIDKISEDFTHSLKPSSLQAYGIASAVPETRTEFLERAKSARSSIFTDGVKITVGNVVIDQPDRVGFFGVESAPSTAPTPGVPFACDVFMLIQLRREADGQLKMTEFTEFVDSVRMTKLVEVMAARGGLGES